MSASTSIAIAKTASSSSPASGEDFGFGLALLDVTGASSLDLVVVSPEAESKHAVRVIENVGSSTDLLPLTALDSAIRLSRNTVIAIGRRAG
jgi:hypothetical protein